MVDFEGEGENFPSRMNQDWEHSPQSRPQDHSADSLERSRRRRSPFLDLEDGRERAGRRPRVNSLKYVRNRRSNTPSRDIPDPIMQKFIKLEKRIAATEPTRCC